jgi:hypothetical protein
MGFVLVRHENCLKKKVFERFPFSENFEIALAFDSIRPSN